MTDGDHFGSRQSSGRRLCVVRQRQSRHLVMGAIATMIDSISWVPCKFQKHPGYWFDQDRFYHETVIAVTQPYAWSGLGTPFYFALPPEKAAIGKHSAEPVRRM
jgi:hypothetical protein